VYCNNPRISMHIVQICRIWWG